MLLSLSEDELIESVTLYRPYFWLFRWDVIPFVIAYSVLFSASLSGSSNSCLFGLVGLPIALLCHVTLFLTKNSSVQLSCCLGNYTVRDVNSAELLLVNTKSNVGKSRIVKLMRRNIPSKDYTPANVKVSGKSFSAPEIHFDFQKITYHYDAGKNTFVRLSYPTKGNLGHILESSGYRSQNELTTALNTWGINEFDIPVPSFIDLYAVSRIHWKLLHAGIRN
jgi:hypothetical protein